MVLPIAPVSSPATAVTILYVDPGGYISLIALFFILLFLYISQVSGSIPNVNFDGS